MVNRIAFAAAGLLLLAAPASAAVLGQASAALEGTFTFTIGASGPIAPGLAPANGAADPLAGDAYGYVAQVEGTFSGASTLPAAAEARYEASGASTRNGLPDGGFGPTELGVFALGDALASLPPSSPLALLTGLPPSGLWIYSDPSGAFDGFFSWGATVIPGPVIPSSVSGVFNGVLGFDDPVLGIDAVVDLVAGFDPVLGEQLEPLLIGAFLDALSGAPSVTTFSRTLDVTASVVPVPVAAPMLLMALAGAAVASRRRRRMA